MSLKNNLAISSKAENNPITRNYIIPAHELKEIYIYIYTYIYKRIFIPMLFAIKLKIPKISNNRRIGTLSYILISD